MSGSPTATNGPRVVVASELADGDIEAGLDLDRWRQLAAAALATEAGRPGELNLVFIDEDAMAELNAAHMGNEGPTDVLAFPIDGVDPPLSLDIPIFYGDVVICPHVARRYAAEHQRSFDDEIALLVVHGILHVLGHDHAEPDETQRMQAREHALLEAHHR